MRAAQGCVAVCRARQVEQRLDEGFEVLRVWLHEDVVRRLQEVVQFPRPQARARVHVDNGTALVLLELWRQVGEDVIC